MIRRLRTGGGDAIAGVLPALDAGSYTVWGPDGSRLAQVVIESGRITEIAPI